jgi:hypothetical protein
VAVAADVVNGASRGGDRYHTLQIAKRPGTPGLFYFYKRLCPHEIYQSTSPDSTSAESINAVLRPHPPPIHYFFRIRQLVNATPIILRLGRSKKAVLHQPQ